MSAPIDLSHLFETHRAALVAYAVAIIRDRAAAEDVVQEAWIRIQAAEAGGRVDRPDAYLYRTVRNLALDRGRRTAFERRHFIQSPDNIDQTVADEVDFKTTAAAREELRLTLKTLRTSPRRMEAGLCLIFSSEKLKLGHRTWLTLGGRHGWRRAWRCSVASNG